MELCCHTSFQASTGYVMKQYDTISEGRGGIVTKAKLFVFLTIMVQGGIQNFPD